MKFSPIQKSAKFMTNMDWNSFFVVVLNLNLAVVELAQEAYLLAVARLVVSEDLAACPVGAFTSLPTAGPGVLISANLRASLPNFSNRAVLVWETMMIYSQILGVEEDRVVGEDVVIEIQMVEENIVERPRQR